MRRISLAILFLVQAGSAIFFVSGIILSVLGVYVPPINWEFREIMEIAAAFSLVLGMIFGAQALLQAQREAGDAHDRLKRISSEFSDLLVERFEAWGLTAAERDVAILTIKGLSVAEIAAARGVSSGTVKAQSNAIYRKASVSGRGGLLSLFLDDLMDEEVMQRLRSAEGTIIEPPTEDAPHQRSA
ncbi:helix-turn-helix transcriptional regulator [Celeribacter litoreus]|uniref:helix-turn-helix transcriptional regulator n=1 Tax=Celeribacter litoreus TaxID=2876714 RepID=UPI001CCB3D56|nr:helix-turn-helix transcriptional regulator [Celeribacter litoreus]MCA0044193.1 helix-turn-helix transcriptional regulator [Celeribacter litoreus]